MQLNVRAVPVAVLSGEVRTVIKIERTELHGEWKPRDPTT